MEFQVQCYESCELALLQFVQLLKTTHFDKPLLAFESSLFRDNSERLKLPFFRAFLPAHY